MNLKRISDFTDANSLDGSEYLILEKNGVTNRVKVSSIANYSGFGRTISIDGNGAISLNLSTIDFVKLTLLSNTVLSISDFGIAPLKFILRVKQGSIGGYSISFSNQFKFPHGLSPVIGTTVGDIEWFIGYMIDGDTVEMFKHDGPIR